MRKAWPSSYHDFKRGENQYSYSQSCCKQILLEGEAGLRKHDDPPPSNAEGYQAPDDGFGLAIRLGMERTGKFQFCPHLGKIS
jgi:hypothetical protein